MSSLNSIEQLYQIVKNTVKAIIGNIVDDLEFEGIEVFEKNLSERLTIKVKDFSDVSQTKVS
jgi:hypothetical protein